MGQKMGTEKQESRGFLGLFRRHKDDDKPVVMMRMMAPTVIHPRKRQSERQRFAAQPLYRRQNSYRRYGS